ncbi:MAG: ParA family protein [Candidatus Doudnabacteria bacterium]|nr:ParA family protein [Candidatus Doudnabacteria bacterium]
MILSVMNQKGGVGKTTTVINLGVYLANAGHKVLLVDLDPQANLTSGLSINVHKDGPTDITGKDSTQKTIYDLLVNSAEPAEIIVKSQTENLEVLPAGIELSGAEVEMVNMMSRENILKSALAKVKKDYELIIIDCPPSLGILTINALTAADKMLIPIQCEYFALEGLGQLMNTIKLVKSKLNPELEIGGVILTMFDNRTNLSRDVANEVRAFFKDTVFEAVIPRNIRLSEAPSHGLSIHDYDAQSAGAKAYSALATEVIKRFITA